ncbi:MAG: redoxin domain-containing protein [Henriciella sp.]|nr:redoxin domain-containing protein [Henriciella sp.]
MLRSMLASVAFVVAAPLASAETDPAEIGPVVGNEAPALTAITSAGDTVGLAEISGGNGAVLVFSRSLDWCPYCKKQALELDDVDETLAEAGWALSLITYDSPELLADFDAESDVSYTLLSDTGSAMIDAFALRNTEMTPGSRFDGVPHPAIVWISNDGIVRGFMREEGYIDRPPTEALPEIAALLNEALAPQ